VHTLEPELRTLHAEGTIDDATVSIDLLIRGLLALGASRREIGRALAE
jgi:hypothetical protein